MFTWIIIAGSITDAAYAGIGYGGKSGCGGYLSSAGSGLQIRSAVKGKCGCSQICFDAGNAHRGFGSVVDADGCGITCRKIW